MTIRMNPSDGIRFLVRENAGCHRQDDVVHVVISEGFVPPRLDFRDGHGAFVRCIAPVTVTSRNMPSRP
jgi:hypothetical protein